MKHTAFILAFNAELTLKKCLEHARPFFDRIIVVEGAVGPEDRWTHNTEQFTGNGRSTDRTVEIANQFDVTLVQKPGFWRDKIEMCNAAVTNTAEDGWLWQIDADEFYHPHDILTLKDKLEYAWKDAVGVEFRAFHFWGGFNHVTDPTKDVWGNEIGWRRIFRFTGKETFLTHEPPVMSAKGRIIDREETTDEGILLYHYGYCWEEQAQRKAAMYNSPQTLQAWEDWKAGRSKLAYSDTPVVRFTGEHPVRFL